MNRGSKSKDNESVTIKNADMSDDMKAEAERLVLDGFVKFNVEKDVASYIKKEFDQMYNPTWHCIVGRNFGSYVTHEAKHFIYMNHSNSMAVLLFKSG